jgi:hypothetical protein
VRKAIAGAAETSENAETFLIRIARGMAADLETSDFKEGCPIATTALETAAQSDVLGAATRGAFQKWEAEIKKRSRAVRTTAERRRRHRNRGVEPARRRASAGADLSKS